MFGINFRTAIGGESGFYCGASRDISGGFLAKQIVAELP